MSINPLIREKINGLDMPDKVKELLKNMLEAELGLELMNTKKEYFKNYDNYLKGFANDEELIKFCEQYDQ